MLAERLQTSARANHYPVIRAGKRRLSCAITFIQPATIGFNIVRLVV
jgi:hypothetical protein